MRSESCWGGEETGFRCLLKALNSDSAGCKGIVRDFKDWEVLRLSEEVSFGKELIYMYR